MIENKNNNEADQERSGLNKQVKLPKNIRQIGQVNDTKRIYVEDYVMTFIKKIAVNNIGTYQVAILLGEIDEREDGTNIFVNGAVEVRDIHFESDKVFSNESWNQIYEDIKNHFGEMEIVGWFLSKPGLSLEMNSKISKLHVNNFAGMNKVLFMYDCAEQEEAFYIYSENKLTKQKGYYIYYDRNDAMQEYMIGEDEGPGIERDYVDRTSQEIRSVLERKRQEKEAPRRKVPVYYMATSLVAVFALIIATAYFTGNRKDSGTSPVVGQIGSNETAAPSSNLDGEETKVVINNGNMNEKETKVTPVPTKAADDTKKDPNDINVTVDGTDPLDENNGSTTNTDANVKEKYYIVQKGDTLGSISFQFYHDKQHIDAIMKLNKIEDKDKIIIGQKLKLP